MLKQILEILSDKHFKLPFKRRQNHFPKAIKQVLDNYCAFVEKLPDEILTQKEKSIIDQLSLHLINTISEYYEGFNSKSFSIFSEGIELIRGKLEYTSPIENNYFYNYPIKTYRIRIGDNKQYSSSEMFHIPFQLRHKVSEQRFSISGLPCLYMGNSIYASWLEMNKPKLNSFQVAKLEFTYNDLKLLDLVHTPHYYSNLIKQEIA